MAPKSNTIHKPDEMLYTGGTLSEDNGVSAPLYAVSTANFTLAHTYTTESIGNFIRIIKGRDAYVYACAEIGNVTTFHAGNGSILRTTPIAFKAQTMYITEDLLVIGGTRGIIRTYNRLDNNSLVRNLTQSDWPIDSLVIIYSIVYAGGYASSLQGWGLNDGVSTESWNIMRINTVCSLGPFVITGGPMANGSTVKMFLPGQPNIWALLKGSATTIYGLMSNVDYVFASDTNGNIYQWSVLDATTSTTTASATTMPTSNTPLAAKATVVPAVPADTSAGESATSLFNLSSIPLIPVIAGAAGVVVGIAVTIYLYRKSKASSSSAKSATSATAGHTSESPAFDFF
jgi:hypothetical protein